MPSPRGRKTYMFPARLRHFFHVSTSVALIFVLSTTVSLRGGQIPPTLGTPALRKIDIDLLDDISRRSFRYFWEQAAPGTGLVMDRALTTGRSALGGDQIRIASIAATGFGLAGICIAENHRWIGREAARERVLETLRFFANEAPGKNGWFYHFLDADTGKRAWNSEVSSIDTAVLLAGILTVRQCLQDEPEVVRLAETIYDRVDFPWMMDGSHSYFSHGWTPEGDFLPYRWDTYSELLILYALGIGSPTHPIAADTWGGWKLPVVTAGTNSYVGRGPLFIHQYSQAWLDLRGRGSRPPTPGDSVVVNRSSLADSYPAYAVDYYANSVAATRAQREFFVNFSAQFPGYSSDVWGITASDSTSGYTDWNATSDHPRIDGTVVPSAAAGSLMFAPDICIPAMRAMLLKHGKSIYGRYGFADAFNPSSGWVSPYVIGIDVGITLLSAENLRTGRVWQWFMANDTTERALDLVGLKKKEAPKAEARFADN
jgi:hypothetical protein